MKRLPIVLGVLALFTAAFALEAAPEVEIREEPLTWRQAAISDGMVLYMEVCAVCHGAGAKGDGPAVPALVTPVPDLTQLALANGGVFPAKEVQDAITGDRMVPAHGTSAMPIWGRAFKDVRPDWKNARRELFARERIYDLTEYLASLQVDSQSE